MSHHLDQIYPDLGLFGRLANQLTRCKNASSRSSRALTVWSVCLWQAYCCNGCVLLLAKDAKLFTLGSMSCIDCVVAATVSICAGIALTAAIMDCSS